MTDEELLIIKEKLLSAETIETDAGKVTERSASDIREVIKLLDELEAKKKGRSSLCRIGRYHRRFCDD